MLHIAMPKAPKTPSSSHRTAPTRSSMATASTSGSPPRAAAATWTPEEDSILKTARTSGLNWGPIAARHFPSKTANACRKRHERLMERQRGDELDGVNVEKLATAYMDVRKEMWKMLAERLDEKWTTVESKCMEKGLKNLQSAFRSAQRKERGMDGADSGIGSSDAEIEIDDGGSPAQVSTFASSISPTAAPHPAPVAQAQPHQNPFGQPGPSQQSPFQPFHHQHQPLSQPSPHQHISPFQHSPYSTQSHQQHQSQTLPGVLAQNLIDENRRHLPALQLDQSRPSHSQQPDQRAHSTQASRRGSSALSIESVLSPSPRDHRDTRRR